MDRSITIRLFTLVTVLLTAILSQGHAAEGRGGDSPPSAPLLFPGLLEKDALYRGNPLATYAAMRERETQYLQSPVFAAMYPEIRFSFEEFLGFPQAGLKAMELPVFSRDYSATDTVFPAGFEIQPALEVIDREAGKTQLVIWGEEHHLPQTRCLYESMIRLLWQQGYRYLAAEAFEDTVMTVGFAHPDYHTGFYVRDPIYASAVRVARDLGYKLIAYETRERGGADDFSFRDRTQAENIYRRIFQADPEAKVLIIAGRGHISEVTDANGWTPMASVLKNLTGIDPLTLYAPTMGERLKADNEHPWYRVAAESGELEEPSIFVDVTDKQLLGSESFDAYVFWPRSGIVHGRPDWMADVLGREPVSVPGRELTDGKLRLAQAFRMGEPATAIPVDQVIVEDSSTDHRLMLPPGQYWVRLIDQASNELIRDTIIVGHPPED